MFWYFMWQHQPTLPLWLMCTNIVQLQPDTFVLLTISSRLCLASLLQTLLLLPGAQLLIRAGARAPASVPSQCARGCCRAARQYCVHGSERIWWSGHSARLENGRLTEMSLVRTRWRTSSTEVSIIVKGFVKGIGRNERDVVSCLLLVVSCETFFPFVSIVRIKPNRFWWRAFYLVSFHLHAFNVRGVHVTPQPGVCGMRREAICRQVKRGQPKSSCK